MVLTGLKSLIRSRFSRSIGSRPKRQKKWRRSILSTDLPAVIELLEDRTLLSIGPLPESTVNHTPYLQLGNAPLVGFDGGTDQIEILWQTIPSGGGGTDDAFDVEYRASGAPTWIDAGAISATPQRNARGMSMCPVPSVSFP